MIKATLLGATWLTPCPQVPAYHPIQEHLLACWREIRSHYKHCQLMTIGVPPAGQVGVPLPQSRDKPPRPAA